LPICEFKGKPYAVNTLVPEIICQRLSEKSLACLRWPGYYYDLPGLKAVDRIDMIQSRKARQYDFVSVLVLFNFILYLRISGDLILALVIPEPCQLLLK
jgi:hypothetical protein